MSDINLFKIRQDIKKTIGFFAYVDIIKNLRLWENKSKELYLKTTIRFIPLNKEGKRYMLNSIKKP